jgi:hypothetical protein
VLFNAGCKKETPGTTNVNVIAHTYSVSSWQFASPNYYTDLGVAELTSSNINTAAVMVYFSKNPGTWIAVPYTQYETLHDYHMNFLTSAGTVEVRWFYDGTSAGSDPNAYYSATIQCKVVVIPQSVRLANPDLDVTNYNAVKTRFDLKD